MLLLLVRLLIRGTSQGLNHADLDLHVDDGFRDLGVRDEEEAKFFRFGLGHFFKMRNHVVHIRQREISEYAFEIFACHPTVRRYGKSALLCYRFQSAVVAEADTQSPPIHFDIAQVLDGCKCRVGVVIFHKGVTFLRVPAVSHDADIHHVPNRGEDLAQSLIRGGAAYIPDENLPLRVARHGSPVARLTAANRV